MLVDGSRFTELPDGSAKQAAIGSFIEFIERRLGVTALYDRRRVPFGRVDLIEPLNLASKLLERGVISRYSSLSGLPDEPPMKKWSCEITDPAKNNSGGASTNDDKAALYAALAEALERYIWLTQQDYFVHPRLCTSHEIQAKHAAIMPERFAAFSADQREHDPRLRLSPDARYLWIEGHSLVTGKRTYVPAQQANALHRPLRSSPKEPLIRTQITNGLATWPTRTGAWLGGALECLEREAYMIMWFNQLTLPRANIKALRQRSASLDTLVARCERYGLRVHIVPMLTDAPTHAVCAVVEDMSSVGPRFVFGLKANRSLVRAAEGAVIEALRARQFTRLGDASKHFDDSAPVDSIGHRGRIYYYAQSPERARHLEFAIAGEEKEFPEAAWENDSIEQHLERLVRWCKENNHECVSVPLTGSKANCMPWHIEMVIMPEIQWTHLTENLRHLGGERLKSVPKKFGYTPRETPFIERPHPYT